MLFIALIRGFMQASTSELYGKVRETPQSETTEFYPRSPYGRLIGLSASGEAVLSVLQLLPSCTASG